MPFLNSVRGVFGAEAGMTSNGPYENFQTLNLTTYGSTTTTSGSGTITVSGYRSTGANGWNTGFYTTNYFTPPFTVEFLKDGNIGIDQNNAYAMIGICPTGKISAFSNTANNNYQYGYMWYPVYSNSLDIYETPAGNSGNTGNTNYGIASGTNVWTPNSTVLRISIDAAGTVNYYYGANAASRTVSAGSGYQWTFHYAGYSANTLSRAYNIKLNQGALWNASTQKYYKA